MTPKSWQSVFGHNATLGHMEEQRDPGEGYLNFPLNHDPVWDTVKKKQKNKQTTANFGMV